MKRVNPPVGLCLENLEKLILMDKEKGKSVTPCIAGNPINRLDLRNLEN